MDWEYIFSVSPEDLTEEEKDDLYNTVTWFNCESENLDQKRWVRLFKMSQEILKYKGEQVEVLLHKLDELATQQGEEEVRKMESDTDGRSSKSRKSSSIEFENLEQKHLELKSKYKKQIRLNEKNSNEINKLQKKIVNLEQEKNRLINELQLMDKDDNNHSDVSETVKEQHKELIDTLHNKNTQISDLLRDIETTEKENIVLREKLTNVRDELSMATKELTLLTENFKAAKIELNESIDNVKKLTAENESLQEEIREILEQKRNFEKEMEEFTEEVNIRVDEWKKILEDREREITELRSRQLQSSHHSSLSSLPQEKEQSQISALNKVLVERENQLLEVKTQLQEAVKEMEESTHVIQKLKEENNFNKKKIADLTESTTELKKLLTTSHERCQELQENLSQNEKLMESKDNDIKDILDKLKMEDKIDLAEILQQNQQLKSNNRVQEKQIMNLVKASNKLQDLCDQYERENEVLRDKLGISADDIINTSDISAKNKQQKKELLSLKKQVHLLDEKNLELRMEIHKLNRALLSYSDGGKQSEEKTGSETSRSLDPEISTKDQLKALVEENEALRKGMHEILDSLNTRKESTLKEVKSETFEKLLRALDVKHISGWYHPAMRLQAELHNQEGINSELREQLRLTRLELQLAKNTKSEDRDVIDSSYLTSKLGVLDLVTINNIHQTLQDLFMKLERDSESNNEIETKLLSYKDNFDQIRQQIGLLYKEYLNEKQTLIDKMSEYEERIMDLEESLEVKENKLLLLIKDSPEEETLVAKSLKLAEDNVILLRKRSYLENDLKRLTNQITNLQNELTQAQSACLKKINDLSVKNKTLASTVDALTNQVKSMIDANDYNEVTNNFEKLTVKYRDLLTNFMQVEKDKEFEIKISEEIRQNLQHDKIELEKKVLDLSEKLYTLQQGEGNKGDTANLAKKLATSEANEISERQRANHTNNLYELVKEQLQKCEERLKHVDKYTKEVLQRNVVLQEQLKDAENKLIDFVDTAVHKSLHSKYNELQQTNDKLNTTVSELREELSIIKSSSKLISHWDSEKEQELLNLKHQIVDLQAVSDEKMQIARLSSEVSHVRSQEAECRRKTEHLMMELNNCNSNCEQLTKQLQQKTCEAIERENEFKKKVSILRELLVKSKLQYLGCVPLPSDEKFVNNIKRAISDKHEAFLCLYNAQIVASESSVMKEHYEKELTDLEQIFKASTGDIETVKQMMMAQQEKKRSQLQEIKFRRQSALKETQLQHVFDRVKIQDEQIIKLEEELFALHKNFSFDVEADAPAITEKAKVEPASIKITKHKETQTDAIHEESVQAEDSLSTLKEELKNVSNEVATKEQIIQQLKNKVAEYEININLIRKQLGDKQSQITFYERHILELQNKKELPESKDQSPNEEVLALKCSIKTFQDSLKQKEEDILKYQSLLKEDRDKHSMAASLMREELKVLQKCLGEEKQKVVELKSSMTGVHPSKAALEQYFIQVHSLEDELSDLRTKVSSLESQLQASRQEAVRWRVLANDRLETMQKLAQDLEELHRNEIATYKNEAEKWRDEVTNLKQMISKYRSEMGYEFDFKKSIKERDDKIHELSVMLRQAKNEARKNIEKSDTESLSKFNELESTKEQLLKEHEAIKRRFDQLLIRERSAREEIRDLKGKLLKKPVSSARSDKSDKSIKEQLQKKITTLEHEIVELKDNLQKQLAINESHRIQISQDFERWNKQKHYQQLSEKLKNKLKAKEADFEKLQETCAGYRILIERLEREKYNLENKIKNLKTNTAQLRNQEIEMLRLENIRLISENEILTSKLEMQQHHSGGLGAAMLQEKLEGQERKIAILELSAKAPVEVRAELERLQNTISSLQKSNLCLEAENLELKLDLEKSSKELPHLREQVHHLENYVEVLKKENVATPDVEANPKTDSKKVAELERTIFVLKRVVEKLQAENKRLLTGKRFYPDRSGSGDKLKRDHQRLKEQYCESVQKVAELKEEVKMLKANQNKSADERVKTLLEELARGKEQLEQKTQLLNRVKILLQRAAVKEKTLLEELNELKLQVGKPNNVEIP